jgi:tellurite resistance protein
MVLNRASSAEGSVGHRHPAEWDPRGKRRTIGYGAAWAGREDGCPVTQIVDKDQSPRRRRFAGLRVPPNLFAIVLGIAGLAEAWHAAVPVLGRVQAVPDVLNVLDAALWLVLVGAYLAQGPRIVLADLRDPVLSPFVPASALTAMLLAAALANGAFAAGRVLVVVFLAVTIAIGGWLTGPWMTGGIGPDSVHPGYFLPTAAGGLIGANAAAQVHLHALAVTSFGIGVICWVMLGSVIMNRLFTRPALPNALVPTMAIELGIPAVAGLAYFAVAGRTVSFVACALGGYAVLMALAQVRLTRQCSCILACRSHSSPQLLQMATQASSSGRVTLASDSVWRLVIPAVAAQMSAQSRHSRMHLTISMTFCSPRSAALSALQAWAQSLSASMAAASTPASTLNVRG